MLNLSTPNAGQSNSADLSSDGYVIELRDVWTCFGSVVIHRDLNLKVQRGEVLSIVGGSGSGKTTLLRHMVGLTVPSRGVVKVLEQDLSEPPSPKQSTWKQFLKPHRQVAIKLAQRQGVLFQGGALFSALSVFDNVALPLRELRIMPKEPLYEAVMLKLAMVGIGPEHVNKFPANLSGGMVKRVALARALVLEPELLFLDEPTAGLDPEASDEFVTLLRGLHRQLRLTVVMVTHDLDTLIALSDRVAVLADQQVIHCGPITEVVQQPHPFIKQFFLGERGRRALMGLQNTADQPHLALHEKTE